LRPRNRPCGRPWRGTLSRVLVAAAILALLASGVPPALAFDPPGVPVPAAERDAWFGRMRTRQQGVTGIEASFVQRRHHPSLKEEVVSEGRLLYKKPAFVRWEVVRPETLTIVMDGKTMTTYFPAKGEAEQKYIAESMAARGMTKFLSDGMSWSLPDLEQRFIVDLFRDGGNYILRLTPRSKWMSRAVSSIRILHAGEEQVPRSVLVLGRRGDRTETVLRDVTVNPSFPEDAFHLVLGPDVRRLDLEEGAGGDGL